MTKSMNRQSHHKSHIDVNGDEDAHVPQVSVLNSHRANHLRTTPALTTSDVAAPFGPSLRAWHLP